MPARNLKRNSDQFIKGIYIALFIGLIAAIIYLPQYARQQKLKRANKELKQRIAGIEQEIQDLQEKIEKVQADPSILEEYARDDLGAAKTDEIVVDIEE